MHLTSWDVFAENASVTPVKQPTNSTLMTCSDVKHDPPRRYPSAKSKLSSAGLVLRTVLIALGSSLILGAGSSSWAQTSAPVLLGANAFPNTTKVGLKFDKVLDAASA